MSADVARYDAMVEVDRVAGPNGEGLDVELVGEALSGHWPVVGVSVAGRWSVQVSVAAVSSPLAAATALALVRAATGAGVVDVRICPGPEPLGRASHPVDHTVDLRPAATGPG